jgi:MFS family permease
VFDERC